VKKAVLLFMAALMLSMTGCINADPPEVDLKEYSMEDVLAVDIKTAEYVKMAVPYSIDENTESFEIKEITKESDKVRVYDFLKDAVLSETTGYEKKTGFDIIIEIKSTDEIYLVFNGSLVLINNKKYYVSEEDLGTAAVALYDSMDYEAKKVE
jgi:hypothetical protein